MSHIGKVEGMSHTGNEPYRESMCLHDSHKLNYATYVQEDNAKPWQTGSSMSIAFV